MGISRKIWAEIACCAFLLCDLWLRFAYVICGCDLRMCVSQWVEGLEFGFKCWRVWIVVGVYVATGCLSFSFFCGCCGCCCLLFLLLLLPFFCYGCGCGGCGCAVYLEEVGAGLPDVDAVPDGREAPLLCVCGSGWWWL